MSDDPYREWAAGYVIGSLSPADRSEYEQHLTACEECRATILSFSPLPGILAKVDEVDLEPPPEHLRDSVVQQALEQQTRLRQSSRLWQGVAAAAVIVALLAGGLFLLERGSSTDGPPTEGRVELTVGSESSVTGSIAVTPQDWGSFILIDLAGLPQRESYTMWAIAHDGRREVAGTWTMGESNTCRVPGSTGIYADDLARVVITASGDEVDELAWGWQAVDS